MSSDVQELVETHSPRSVMRTAEDKNFGPRPQPKVDLDVEGIRKMLETSRIALSEGKEISSLLLHRLRDFLTDPRAITARKQIQESLRFECRLDRYDRIKEAHTSTYEWIFEEDAGCSGNFTRWLRSEDGIFWISGKAGCGKSTVMKFLSGHSKTDASLMKWADGRRLFVASYYFWNPCTEMQKSQKGLLQSILHDILHQVPALAEKPIRGVGILKIHTSTAGSLGRS
jgi:hypothetical protein